MVEEDGFVKVAQTLGIPPATLRSHLVAQGLPTARGQKVPGSQTFTLDNLPEGADWTPEKLLELVGLDPHKWVIRTVKVRGGHWGRPDDPSSQVRLELTVDPVAMPFEFPDPGSWKPLPKPKKRKAGKVETVVVLSDQHAPFHSKPMHELTCRYLAEEKPDRIICAGDLLDFPDISRHRTIPGDKYDASVNECLQAGYDLLRDYREAAPDAQMQMIPGNHDIRLATKIIDQADKVWNIRAANDDVPALSLRRLLHLDHLHIDFIDETDWTRAKVKINRRLTVRHGHTTKKNPGPQLLASLGGSTIQGHSHRTSALYNTMHSEEGPEFRVAAETGCMCQIDETGLGYTTEPDWQNAFLKVVAFEDDDFLISTCIFLKNPDRLLIPDGRRYEL